MLMRAGALAAVVSSVVVSLAAAPGGAALATGASADTLTAPEVFVRVLTSEHNTPWQPLSGQVDSLGPYEIGVKLQSTTAFANRQAYQVDLVSAPGSDPADPFTPFCELMAAPTGTIQETGSVVYFHGNGAYVLDVSAYTYDQWNARPGNTCSGGPASNVALNVVSAPVAQIAGSPLAPRLARPAHGFAGFTFTAPEGNLGYEWRCARDPVAAADGSLTGTDMTHAHDSSASGSPIRVREEDAFTRPGRWACAARLFGGHDGIDVAGYAATPWARSATITVQGEYARDATRTRIAALGRRQLRLTVPAIRPVAAAAARGKLRLVLYRAGCRKTKVVPHRVASSQATLDARGIATFRLRQPTRAAFYFARLTFAGTSLVLRGPDPSIMLFQTTLDPAHPLGAARLGFSPPGTWVPC